MTVINAQTYQGIPAEEVLISRGQCSGLAVAFQSLLRLGKRGEVFPRLGHHAGREQQGGENCRHSHHAEHDIEEVDQVLQVDDCGDHDAREIKQGQWDAGFWAEQKYAALGHVVGKADHRRETETEHAEQQKIGANTRRNDFFRNRIEFDKVRRKPLG